MPWVLRSRTGRAVWAGMTAVALAGSAVAQAPVDPIAASNRLNDPWVAAGGKKMAAEVSAPVAPVEPKPMPLAPPGKALLDRIKAPISPAIAPPPPQEWVAPPVRPSVAAPVQTVAWSIPDRQPITNIMPVSDRKMMPCEPVFVAAAVVPLPPPPPTPAPIIMPMGPLPPPQALSPEDGEQQTATPSAPPPQPTMTATTPDDDLTPKPVTTIRFLDDPPAPKPTVEPTVLMAVMRRGGASTGTAADIRGAVERVCQNKVVECQTEVAGERQVRVALTVHTAADWQKLYERMQNLPELGEYGLVFEVKVEK